MTRLFHISDVHFGAADLAALAWFEKVVAAEQPDAIVLTGDLTFRARRREFEAAAKWIGRLGRPVAVSPGNHDLPYFNPLARIASPYRRYREIENSVARPLKFDNVTIVPLDTTAAFQWRLNWASGRVKERRLQRAVRTALSAPVGDLVLIACHHPLIEVDPREKVGTRGGLDALAWLAEAGADAVLSGHLHNPFDVAWDVAGRNVRLIGAGTLSERVRETRPSFNELRIESGRLDNRLREMA